MTDYQKKIMDKLDSYAGNTPGRRMVETIASVRYTMIRASINELQASYETYTQIRRLWGTPIGNIESNDEQN